MYKIIHKVSAASLLAVLPIILPASAAASTPPKTENLDSLGSTESNDERSEGLSAEAHTTEKNETGNLLSITWSIKNKGNYEAFFNWPSGESYMYSDPVYFSGVTITSADGLTRYHPVMDGASECLCSGNSSPEFKERIDPGEQVAYWSMYSVPEDVDTITLEIPGFEPIEDIPIS